MFGYFRGKGLKAAKAKPSFMLGEIFGSFRGNSLKAAKNKASLMLG
jgi:hypothetical protein